MSKSTRAVLSAAAAALLAVSALAGSYAPHAVVAAFVLIFAYGWPLLMAAPWVGGARIVLALAGLGGMTTVHFVGNGLASLPAVVATGLVLAFVTEMLRRDGRAGMVESLVGTVTGVVVVACGAGWIAIFAADAGAQLTVNAAVALAVAAAVAAAWPWTGWQNALATIGAAALAGAGVALALPPCTALEGAVVGLLAGVLTASLYVLLELVPTASKRPAALAAAVVPVLLAGILTDVVGQMLGTI